MGIIEDAKNNQSRKFIRAQKKVENIKLFYNHVGVYVVCVSLMLLFKNVLVINVVSAKVLGNVEYLEWINWNVYGTPILWGIAILFHALSVFKFKIPFICKWEERQLEKYMKEDKLN